ncbi:MAG: hypothetical protein KatS3mg031_0950 [Chitinophagales bacterium]|nr:MAG: hypothetical protein KatS3mg031_0950 [Chitinophagales bacterium]
MKRLIRGVLVAALVYNASVFAQGVIGAVNTIPGKVNINGKLDMLDEFSTLYVVPIEMPDGIKLMTDITLPVTQDSMTIQLPGSIEISPGFEIPAGETITLIPKGIQLFFYDSLNGAPNPDPYSLPMIFTRTPYDKYGDVAGRIISLFGYAYALQDMRGRYSSEGVYFPMMSDSWNKNSIHPHFKHILDDTDMKDPKNGNRHEDGYNSVQFLVNRLYRQYDINNDGTLETFPVCNGSLGMFGASALGNTQYQAAAAHKIDPMSRGLKALLPIVATLEHYKYTGYQNGVFRERIVTGWLKGQIFDVEDDLIPIDFDKQNNIHTSADYDLPKSITINNRTRVYQPNQFDASALAIDHFVRMRYAKSDGVEGLPGYYPNSDGRGDMDGSFAPVDVNGESVMKGKIDRDPNSPTFGKVIDVPDSDPEGILGFGNSPRPNLIYSRYRNMDVPAYHLTGWWDIFTDGQIETWRLMREAQYEIGSKSAKLQKLVIGPWVHQTIGSTLTGDLEYKDNVNDILGFDIGTQDLEDLAVEDILRSEIVSWFRYNLNYNEFANIGLPKVKIPESKVWQPVAGGLLEVRVPSEDYIITFNELINFINGTGDLKGVKAQGRILGFIPIDTVLNIPPLNEPIVPELDGKPISSLVDSIDFEKVADVRFYVIGPIDDGYVQYNPNTGQWDTVNATTGNYWFHSDTFPIVKNIRWKNLYMHQNGSLDYNPPTEDEGYSVYVHDPDDPVLTIGGANMIVDLPFGYKNLKENTSRSHGQINLADPRWRHTTMDRHGVIAFETEVLQDTLSVIGFPVVKLYAKSNPAGKNEGPTDTDFFVRVLDVYPDGRQFFVTEGCVNARARDYAAYMAVNDGLENPNIPFTNIEIGKIYEYHFRIMPIGYTWGKGHRLKILISSSNYNRYQVNPNLPIEDGDFFRRQPLDGQKYIFQGEEMAARIAVQRIAHSPQYPSHISLPVYDKTYTGVDEVQLPAKPGSQLDIVVWPNPATEYVNIYASKSRDYDLLVYNELGEEVYQTRFTEQVTLPTGKFSKGLYFVEVKDVRAGESVTQKITIQ